MNYTAVLPLLQAATDSSGQTITMFITFGLVIVIFYFFIIRPQNKKQKETEKMISAIKKNDKIITIGGIRGTVHAVKDDTVIVRVDDEVKLEFSKNAIATVVEQRKEEDKPEA